MSRTIRPPREDELELLRDIEWAAGTLFNDVDLPDIADAEPASVEELAVYVADARAWVSTEDDVPVGYAIVDVVDGLAHLEQLSVVPDHGRRGHGAALLAHIAAWAHQNGYAAVTLTTFTDIPFNAPYYAKNGYTVIADADLGPELRALRNLEAEHGLDPALRVCMRRDV
jgi:GNAT superfamily N-acetyltransferase